MDILGFTEESASLKLNIRLNMEVPEHSIYVNYSDVIGLVLRDKVFEADLLPKKSVVIYVKRPGDSFDKMTRLGINVGLGDRFSDHPTFFPASGKATLFAFASNTLINTSIMLDRLRKGPGEYLKLKKPVANTEPFEERYDQDAITLESLVSVPLKDLVIAGYGERGNYIVSRKQLEDTLGGARIDDYNVTYARLPGMYGFLFPTRNGSNLNEERSDRVRRAYKVMKILFRETEGQPLPYIDAFDKNVLGYEGMSNEELNKELEENLGNIDVIRTIVKTEGFHLAKDYLPKFMSVRSMNMTPQMKAYLESIPYSEGLHRFYLKKALVKAIKEHRNQYIDILINYGADVNGYDTEEVAYFYVLAARYNNVVAMESLLIAGANISEDRDRDFSASTEAELNGHAEILELMYKAGRDPPLEEYVEDAHPRVRPIMLKWIRMSDAKRRAEREAWQRYRREEFPKRFPRLTFPQPSTPETNHLAPEDRRSGSPIPLDLVSDDLPIFEPIGDGFSQFKNKYFK